MGVENLVEMLLGDFAEAAEFVIPRIDRQHVDTSRLVLDRRVNAVEVVSWVMAKTSRSNSQTGRTIAVRFARPDQNGEVATSTSCMRASAVSTRPRCGQRISPPRLVHCKFANMTH